MSLSGHCRVMNKLKGWPSCPVVAQTGKFRLRHEGLRNAGYGTYWEKWYKRGKQGLMLSPCEVCPQLHRCHVLRLERWTEAKDLQKARHRLQVKHWYSGFQGGFHGDTPTWTAGLAHGRSRLDFCEEFLKTDLSKNIENAEVKGFTVPITASQSLQNQHCCSGKGPLPVGRTLKEGAK